MAKRAYIVGDIVESLAEDINQRIEDVPVALENRPPDELLWNGTAVVDALTLTEFYIDPQGTKHAQNLATSKVSVTGTFTLNRRASLADRFERTAGSWVTDGFVVGDIVSVSGTVSNDKVFKIVSVSASYMNIDETVSRVSPDETVEMTIETGWQKIYSTTFRAPIVLENGIWRDKTDDELHTEAKELFETNADADADAWVSTNGGTYPARRREQAEYEAAQMRIARASSTMTLEQLANDGWNFGTDILDKVIASQTALTLTFNAANHTVTRSAGSWDTDGFRRAMQVTFTGTTSNNKTFTIVSFTATVLTLSTSVKEPEVVDETATADCAASAITTLIGYRRFRGVDDPGDFPSSYAEQFMEGAIINVWFDRIRTTRRDHVDGARTSGIWTGSTPYVVGDIEWVKALNAFKKCNTAHTSSADFNTDVANWDDYLPDGATYPDYPTEQLTRE